MSTKRAKEFKNLTKEELMNRVRDTEANLFKARMQNKIGQLENTASINRYRKDMAVLKTVLTQRQTAEAAPKA